MKRASGRKAKSPAFQFYPGDYLTDGRILALSFEQRGLWLHLICLAWLNEGLDPDLSILARSCGLQRKALDRLWPGVAWCFELRDGKLKNQRQERERAAQEENRRLSSEGGKRGNETRWGKETVSPTDRHPITETSPPSPVSRISNSNSAPTERAEAPPAGPPAVRPKRAEPTGPDAEFREWWCRAFLEKTGNSYGWDFGKDSKLLSGILKRIGIDEAKARALRLLHAPAEWLIRNGDGIDIGTLYSQLNKLASAGKLTASNPVRELAIDAATQTEPKPLMLGQPRRRA